jgi:SRSO17 transposase
MTKQSATPPKLAPLPSAADVRVWAAELDGVAATLAPRFERAEPRQRVLRYLTGLLSAAERKNGWQLAELAGETTPDGMQRLLSTAHWDADAVRDDLVAYVLAHVGDPAAVLVLDETGFVKKGAKSVGVAPQYCGAVGKIANCQIGVFLAYATAAGPVLLDRELYLPKAWGDDVERRAEAGVPPQVAARPKPALGQALLERAFAAGVRAAWVTADSVYGGAYPLRHFLEERAQPFVLAVPSTQRVGLTAKAAQVVASWPQEAWERLSAGEGSQGPRWYDWAWMPMPWRDAPEDMAHYLLARRSVSQPDECAYYFVFGPDDVTLQQLALVAGTRWQVEQAFELAKGEVGLDEYEVRTWTGWYRHVTLAMFALAYLTVVRQRA